MIEHSTSDERIAAERDPALKLAVVGMAIVAVLLVGLNGGGEPAPSAACEASIAPPAVTRVAVDPNYIDTDWTAKVVRP